MRRLSINRLKTAASQCGTKARDVAVIFNGELYNYRELRERLMLSGSISTQSDTEILVHAWEEWGEDCLEELRGCRAGASGFAEAGMPRRPLLFLRARSAWHQALYYTQTNDGFAFASEVRALLAGEWRTKRFRRRADVLLPLRQRFGASGAAGRSIFASLGTACCCTCRNAAHARARSVWDATRSPATKEARQYGIFLPQREVCGRG